MLGNHPVVRSLIPCSEVLICISPKSQANKLLDCLQCQHNFRLFYTIISIQTCGKNWSADELKWFLTDETRYSVEMLHSLGYVFDDKYLFNSTIRNRIIRCAEEDQQTFYQLVQLAIAQLRKCHWTDLLNIFNVNKWRSVSVAHRQVVEKRKKIDQLELFVFAFLVVQIDDKTVLVPVVHLTPTRLSIMAKEKSKGHRAMRHPAFHSVDDFCLVYLKPDPPNLYLNDHPETIKYFEEIFRRGIELIGQRFHLFGTSNSQIKEHSFWFLKASSLDEIHRKRQLLGRFDQINNVGTYVARLGLWFSKTEPTDVSRSIENTDFYSRAPTPFSLLAETSILFE